MTYELDENLLELLSSGDEAVPPMLDLPYVPRISTGSRMLNWATGGGFPCGMTTMLWGYEGSGKSTTIYLSIAELLRAYPGASVAMIMTEAIDREWPEKLGVDFRRVALYEPRTIEQGMDILTRLIKKGVVWAIYFDSLGMIATDKEVEGDIGDVTVAGNARIIGDFFKRHSGNLWRSSRIDLETGEKQETPPALILTAHVNEKIGVLYGSPETMNGGRRLKHALDLWIRFGTSSREKSTLLDDSGEVTAVIHTGVIKKNKVGKPFREFAFTVRQDGENYGVDAVLEIAELAFRLGLIENKVCERWKNGDPYFQGQKLPIDSYSAPKDEKNKTRHKVALLLYDDDRWYALLANAVNAAIGAHTDLLDPEDETGTLVPITP